MKLDRRIDALENRIAPDFRIHIIHCGPGYGDDGNEVWAARNDAALVAYGRDRVKSGERVMFIHLIGVRGGPAPRMIVTPK